MFSIVAMHSHLLNQFGLILNIVGTILVAFSFGDPPSTAQQFKNGRAINLAAFLHPRWFKIGVALIIVGFVCMFVATIF